MKKKYKIYDSINPDGSIIPNTGKRYSTEDLEEAALDGIGELIFDQEEWLSEQLNEIKKLKINLKEVSPDVLLYIGVTRDIINYFLKQKRETTNKAKVKNQSSIQARKHTRNEAKEHFEKWKLNKTFSSERALITAYIRSTEVKKWYKKNGQEVPKRTTITAWGK